MLNFTKTPNKNAPESPISPFEPSALWSSRQKQCVLTQTAGERNQSGLGLLILFRHTRQSYQTQKTKTFNREKALSGLSVFAGRVGGVQCIGAARRKSEGFRAAFRYAYRQVLGSGYRTRK